MPSDITVAKLQGTLDSANANRKLLVDSDGRLLVAATVSGGSSTEYTEGATDTTLTGVVAMTEGPSDTATPLQTDASKNLKVTTKTDLTPASPTAATVGTSSASVVSSNSSRTGLVLTNTSSNIISIGIGAAAVLNSGITLYPGGHWEMDEYTFDTGQINAIASAGSSNLAIQEFS